MFKVNEIIWKSNVYIENTIFISSLPDVTRNSVGMARLAEPVRRVSGRAWLTWNQNTFTWFSFYHALLKDLRAKRQRNKWKADAVLFELADVANALWCKSVTSFNQSKRCYHGQRQYLPILFRDRFWRHRLIAFAQAQFNSDLISYNYVIIPLLSGEFCSRCMIKYVLFGYFLFGTDALLFEHIRHGKFINYIYPATDYICYSFRFLLFDLLSCYKVKLWISTSFRTTGIC